MLMGQQIRRPLGGLTKLENQKKSPLRVLHIMYCVLRKWKG